jgi:hypothetical protein
MSFLLTDTSHICASTMLVLLVEMKWDILQSYNMRRMCLKCDGTRAETRFCLSAKRTSPFKSAGESVQSTTGSRGVRMTGSNTWIQPVPW